MDAFLERGLNVEGGMNWRDKTGLGFEGRGGEEGRSWGGDQRKRANEYTQAM